MVSDASDELDTIMVSDASEEFEAPQEPGTPALRRSSRRIRFWGGSSKKMSRAKICPMCEASPGPKKGGRPPGEWANGLCQRHALESGCRPPRRKKRRVMCKTCQEIGRKEDDAADKVVRTKFTFAQRGSCHGMCIRHARLAGLSRKEKLFDGRKRAAPGDAGKKQKKLPFFMVPKKSQSQMAVDGSIEDESHGSIEPPPLNP